MCRKRIDYFSLINTTHAAPISRYTPAISNIIGWLPTALSTRPPVAAAMICGRQITQLKRPRNVPMRGFPSISRGKKGVAVVNLSDKAQPLGVATTLANGTYKDVVSGKKYQVKKGKVVGQIDPLSALLLVK